MGICYGSDPTKFPKRISFAILTMEMLKDFEWERNEGKEEEEEEQEQEQDDEEEEEEE
jgi:hypothetical protein